MGKTLRQKAFSKDGKQDRLDNLKHQLKAEKEATKKLEREIADLKKQLESVGKTPRPKPEKPPKLTPEEKAQKLKDELKQRLRERFSPKKAENAT